MKPVTRWIIFLIVTAWPIVSLSHAEEELQYSLKKVYYTDLNRTLDYDFSAGTQSSIGGEAPNVDQIQIPSDPFITGIDRLKFVLNVNQDHFTLDTTAKALILKGTTTPEPGCTSMGCSASGGLEYTDGIFTFADAQARAETNFFYAVRLQDFKSFSADKFNAFVYGFVGNNQEGREDFPTARVTARWIEGYYCGHLFEGELVLEAQINSDKPSFTTLFDFSVTNGGGFIVPGVTLPESLVIDLAIEGSQNGEKVTFYYRTGGVVESLDKSSGGWLAFTSYTTNGNPFYGYPVNKGLQGLIASDLSYPPTVPAEHPVNSGKGIEVIDTDSITVTEESLGRDYRVVKFHPISNKKIIVYNCLPESLTAIRSKFSGLSRKPSELNVAKLKNKGGSLPYGDYRTSFDSVISGDWAITAADGTTFVDFNQTLTPGAEYYFYIFIRDNDSRYDLDPTLGRIEDPAVIGIGTPEVAPPNITGPVMLLLGD